MRKDTKLHSIKKGLGNLLIAFIMLILFAQALLITELITRSFRILSLVTVCQQGRNLCLQVVQVRQKIWFCVANRRPGRTYTRIYLYMLRRGQLKCEATRAEPIFRLSAKRTSQFNLQAPRFLYIGQAFRYSPENAFYIFNQQIYFII